MQKQVTKKVLKQQAQQVDLNQTIEYYNYNSKITLLSFLNSMHHKTWSIDKTRSLARTDPISNSMVDIVLAYLPLKQKQKIIVCEVMHHTIYNQATFKSEQSNQLLLVVRGKSNIGKSQIIKAIYQACDIISKVNQIFITALIGAAANNISGCTLYIILRIDIRKTKESIKRQQKLEKLW